MCSLVTYTVQFNPSLHVYFISDIIVLKCVKTHVSRISLLFHSKMTFTRKNPEIFMAVARGTDPYS